MRFSKWFVAFLMGLGIASSSQAEITVSRYDASTFLIEGDEEDDYVGVIHAANGAGVTINNVFYPNGESVIVLGGPGDDWIDVDASANADPLGSTVAGEEGDDTIIVVGDSFGFYDGGFGNDTMYMLDCTDCVMGGSQDNDGLYVAGNCVRATVDGDQGNDGIEAIHNMSPVEIEGGPGSDLILSSPFMDEVNGDWYTTETGTDTLYQIGNVADNHVNIENVQGNPPDPR